MLDDSRQRRYAATHRCLFMRDYVEIFAISLFERSAWLGLHKQSHGPQFKRVIQRIVEKDRAMKDLAIKATYLVASNTGLPLSVHLVQESAGSSCCPITYVVQRHHRHATGSEFNQDEAFSEVKIWVGLLTVTRGLSWRFPGKKK